MKKLLLALLLGIFILNNSFAQQTLVNGTVQGDEGEPLPGVNITIKGTTTGRITNLDGYFEIEVNDPQNDVLTFSFVGYEIQEIPVGGRTRIDVQLLTSLTALEEVVAIGYGSMRRRDLTGAISSVDADAIGNTPTFSVAAALQGKVAGVSITSTEGSPDAEIKIRVRGGGSITQSNEPLYVIDGFASEGGINSIDPTEIESIEILKDASSAAIYGSRGSNGVILITTKRGVEGQFTVNYDMYYGFKKIVKKIDLFTPYEFVLKEYELATTSIRQEEFLLRYGEFEDIKTNYLNRAGIDWQEVTFGDAVSNQYHKLSVSGGNDVTKLYFSGSHNKDNGIMVLSGFKRSSARLNLEHKLNNFVTASMNFGYSDQSTWGTGTSSGGEYFSKLSHVLQYRPTIGLGNDQDLIDLDQDPVYEDSSGNPQQNPLTSAEAEIRDKRRKTLNIQASLKFDFTKHLSLNLSGGIREDNYRYNRADLMRSASARRGNGLPSVEIQTYNRANSELNAYLQYSRDIGEDHSLNVMVGSEYSDEWRKDYNVEASTFPNDDLVLSNLNYGVPVTIGTFEQGFKLASLFSRAFYNYKDRYMLTATIRADGSSKFAPENRWGYFPSASFAWRVSEESFLDAVDQISNLKLRLSYGALGNNRISNYAYMSVLDNVTYGFNQSTVPGVAPDNIPNSALKWETTKSSNLGVDVGIFNSRIQLTTELYRARTTDLLLAAKVPLSTGFEDTFKNIGETENKGIELTLTTINVQKPDFYWSTDFNLSFNKNEVIALADGALFFYEKADWGGSSFNDNDYIIEVGRPIGQIFGYISDGLYTLEDFTYDEVTQRYILNDGVITEAGFRPTEPQPGYAKYKDVDGNGVVDEDDRTVIGDANPVFFGGIMNTLNYKNFDLSVFINFSYGNDIYNANRLYYSKEVDDDSDNAPAMMNDRWLTFDPETGIRTNDPETMARLNANAIYPSVDGNNKLHLSTAHIEDGSFIKLNNISLGYSLPKNLLNKVKIAKLRVYTTLYNIYTLTNYSGYDPEVSTRDNNGLTPGVDWGSYPRSRSIVFGVNLSF